MTYGWRQVFLGQREKHELAREKMWARIHLTPLLQAEEDRDQVRRHLADLERERELLGGVSSAYNGSRYVLQLSIGIVLGGYVDIVWRVGSRREKWRQQITLLAVGRRGHEMMDKFSEDYN
jgi:hypothetical protein